MRPRAYDWIVRPPPGSCTAAGTPIAEPWSPPTTRLRTPTTAPPRAIVRRQTNRSPQLLKSVIVLRDTRIVMPAFVGARPVQS